MTGGPGVCGSKEPLLWMMKGGCALAEPCCEECRVQGKVVNGATLWQTKSSVKVEAVCIVKLYRVQ